MFGQILVEFLFRLTFGIAVAMAVAPSRDVTGGFFRVHLWVLMGFQTLAALALYSMNPLSNPGSQSAPSAALAWQFWLAVAAAAISYVGAVIWMYERRWLGKLAIVVVAGCTLAGCTLPVLAGTKPVLWQLADRTTGGLLLGSVTAAMLLGHWYLNTPTMRLGPLQRLIGLIALAIVLRAVVCFGGVWMEVAGRLALEAPPASTFWMFLALRWLAGIVCLVPVAWLTWLTLKIPNTQSATGILYAGIILAFIGELTSQLLSAEARYPI